MRVGVVVDPFTLDRVMCDHVLEVQRSGRHQVSLVAYDAYGFGEKRAVPPLRRYLIKPLYRLTNMLAKALHILRQRKHRSFDYWRDRRRRLVLTDAIPSLAAIESIEVKPQRVGKYRYEYPLEVIEQIAARCDILFLAGAGRILAGEILTRVPGGVLSFHPADTQKYKGRPGGFFEWINDEKELGITLQRLNSSLDGGEIVLVRRIDLSAEPSMVSAMHSLSMARRGMLLEGLDILDRKPEPVLTFPPPTPVNHEKDAETIGNLWKYMVRHIIRCLRVPRPAGDDS